MKNYIGLVNDHSGSMRSLETPAMNDYNSTIEAIASSAFAQKLDTIVSVVGIGIGYGQHPRGQGIMHQLTISNPNVLRPITEWRTAGGTPLFDGIAEIIKQFESLPDANNENVSFLVTVTTDGGDNESVEWDTFKLRVKINSLHNTGRWTFTARVPTAYAKERLISAGFPEGNIQIWETTAEGFATATAQHTQAVNTYFTQRSTGARSSSGFYTDASNVNLAALTDVSKEISLYVVPVGSNGIEIRDFILKHRMEYLKGAAFYQLTKSESRVSHTKQVLVRDQATGKFFGGAEARKMIGLPEGRNARLHPGDHKNFDIFIQSESVNRKLVEGTGIAYWAKIGVPFTEADTAHLKPKAKIPFPGVTALPVVTPTNKPTKSPIPVTPRREYFETREEARQHCRLNGISQTLIEHHKNSFSQFKRWSAPLKAPK